MNNNKYKLSQKKYIYGFISLLAVVARFALFPFASGDYAQFLSAWFEELKANGGIMAIGHSIGDYSPIYILLMALLTYIPINSLYLIKTISCVADFIMAVFGMKIIFFTTQSSKKALFSFSLILMLPTVLLNSAAWSQSDSIYTGALLACLYYALLNEPRKSMVAYAVAFAFKLQAIFFFPFICLLIIKKRVRLSQLLYIPLIYFATGIPAMIAGRSIFEIGLIYFNQAASYYSLSMNAPNLYALFPANSFLLSISVAGICVFLTLFLLLIYFVYTLHFPMSNNLIVHFALFSSLFVPFFLPHMHERYFYLADILSVIFFFIQPARWYVPMIVVGSSFCVYVMYLFGTQPISTVYLAFMLLSLLFILANDMKRIIANDTVIKSSI